MKYKLPLRLASDVYPEVHIDEYVVRYGIVVLDAEGEPLASVPATRLTGEEWTADAIRALAKRFVDSFNGYEPMLAAAKQARESLLPFAEKYSSPNFAITAIDDAIAHAQAEGK